MRPGDRSRKWHRAAGSLWEVLWAGGGTSAPEFGMEAGNCGTLPRGADVHLEPQQVLGLSQETGGHIPGRGNCVALARPGSRKKLH